jgi:hypothetical protein
MAHRARVDVFLTTPCWQVDTRRRPTCTAKRSRRATPVLPQRRPRWTGYCITPRRLPAPRQSSTAVLWGDQAALLALRMTVRFNQARLDDDAGRLEAAEAGYRALMKDYPSYTDGGGA